MKTNKLDKFFRAGLEDYEIAPSEATVERFRRDLARRHRSATARRWLRAAGFVFLGAGILWLAGTLNQTGEQVLQRGEVAGVAQPAAGEKSEIPKLQEGRVQKEPDKEKETRVRTTSPEKTAVGRSLAVQSGRHPENPRGGTTPSDRTLAGTESVANARQIIAKNEVPGAQERSRAELENPGKEMERENLSGEKNAIHASLPGREYVPVRIVYKKSAGEKRKTEQDNRDKGLLKRGYKKIAAVLDRINIKEGARDRLQKTKEELVVMNPAKLFKKEGER